MKLKILFFVLLAVLSIVLGWSNFEHKTIFVYADLVVDSLLVILGIFLFVSVYRNQKQKLEKTKKEMEEEVCKTRRQTGICPLIDRVKCEGKCYCQEKGINDVFLTACTGNPETCLRETCCSKPQQ
jgi:hypothetical protein